MRQTGFGEVPFVPRFDKETAFVLKVVDINNDESVEGCFGDACFHTLDRFIMNL
jgi:hypothetical protein